MKTKKWLTLGALIVGLAMAAPSHATLIIYTIDNFDLEQGPLIDKTVNGVKLSDTNSVRTLTHELMATNGLPFSMAQVGVLDDGRTVLDISNTPGEDSEVTVSWLLNPNLIAPMYANGSQYIFDIVITDENPANIVFSFKETGAASFSFLKTFDLSRSVINKSESFAMSLSEVNKINLGGVLKMAINGTIGLDLTLDAIGFAYIPPPPTPAIKTTIGIQSIRYAGIGFYRFKRHG